MISTLIVIGVVLAVLVYVGPKVFRVKWFHLRKSVEEKLSNPIQEVQYDLDKAKKELKQKEASVVKLMTQQKSLERRKKDITEEIAKYENVAQAAGKKGKKSDVTIAVKRKLKLEQSESDISEEILANANVLLTLQNLVEQYKDAIYDAENKSTQLQARVESANLREQLLSTDNDEGIAGLKNFEDKVEAIEDRVNAKTDYLQVDNLINRYESTPDVDAHVSRYLDVSSDSSSSSSDSDGGSDD